MCIKLDLHLTLTPPLRCKYSSMLHFLWWDKGAHFFSTVYTLVGSKDVDIWLPSLVNAYSILCMLCQKYFWEVQHCLHSEHDKISFYRLIKSCSAVLWNKHVPPWPSGVRPFLLFAPLCHFFHSQTKSVVNSSFPAFFFFLLFPQIPICFF